MDIVATDAAELDGFAERYAAAHAAELAAEQRRAWDEVFADHNRRMDQLEGLEPEAQERRAKLYALARPVVPRPDADEPLRAILRTPDGTPVVYEGELNSIQGDKGGGKSWLGLICATETLRRDGRVIWWDAEDAHTHRVYERALLLGAADAVADSDRFLWLPPELHDPEDADAKHGATEWLLEAAGPALIVVDAAESHGAAPDGAPVRQWAKNLMGALTAPGVTLLLIDHVGKHRDSRGRTGTSAVGSAGKGAHITGLSAYVAGQPWGPNLDGRLTLRLDKDRPGGIEARQGDAIATIAGTWQDGAFAWQLGDADRDAPHNDGPDAGDAILAALLAAGLEGIPSKRAMRDAVPGSNGHTDHTLERLLETGLIAKAKHGQSHRYTITTAGTDAVTRQRA